LPLLLRENSPLPSRLRRAVERLGGAWIKLGQVLALRFDLLPAEYCSEFLKLLNEATPIAYKEVRELFREELGGYPEQIFRSFEQAPIAAASIAQVHRATTFSGKRVAVKIQRPSIRRQFAADFVLMRALSYGLQLIDRHGARSAREFIDEFRRWTDEELEFRYEARNGHRMGLFSEGDPVHVDAKVYFEYTTSRILTTEYLNGIPLLDIIRAIHQSDQNYLKALEGRGVDLSIIARNISWNLLNQTFRDGFYHADLHPANLVVLPGNAIGYFDFGIVGRLTEDLRESLQAYVRSLFQGDFDRAVTEVLRWVTPHATTNMERARQDLILTFENYRYGTVDPAGDRKPLQLTSKYIAEMMSVARNNRITISQNLILYFKAAMTADAVVFEIAPNYDVFREVDRFIARSLDMDLREAMAPARIRAAILTVGHRLSDVADEVSTIRGAGQTVHVWLDTLQTRLLFYGFWAVAFGVGSYATYKGGGEEYLPVAFDAVRYWVSGGMLLGLLTFLLLIWRQGRELAASDVGGATNRARIDWHLPHVH
jgi:ubiquinone biosynthesis protein